MWGLGVELSLLRKQQVLNFWAISLAPCLLFNYMFAYVSICEWVYRSFQRPEERVKSPEAEVTGSCELPDAGTRNQTPIFCKSSKGSLPSLQLGLKNPPPKWVFLSGLLSSAPLWAACTGTRWSQPQHSPRDLSVCLTFFSSKLRSKHHTNRRFQAECREEGIVIQVCSEWRGKSAP